jgi:hypothetical protein
MAEKRFDPKKSHKVIVSKNGPLRIYLQNGEKFDHRGQHIGAMKAGRDDK